MAGKLNSNNILKKCTIQCWHRKLLKLSAPSIKEKGDRWVVREVNEYRGFFSALLSSFIATQCWRLLSLIPNARQCWLLIPYLPSIMDILNQFFCLLFLPGIVPRTNSKPGPWERRHGYRIAAGASGCIPAPEPGAGTGWSQDQQPRHTEHRRISPGGASPSSEQWVESSLLLPRERAHTVGCEVSQHAPGSGLYSEGRLQWIY